MCGWAVRKILFTNLTLEPLKNIFVNHPAVVGLYI